MLSFWRLAKLTLIGVPCSYGRINCSDHRFGEGLELFFGHGLVSCLTVVVNWSLSGVTSPGAAVSVQITMAKAPDNRIGTSGGPNPDKRHLPPFFQGKTDASIICYRSASKPVNGTCRGRIVRSAGTCAA